MQRNNIIEQQAIKNNHQNSIQNNPKSIAEREIIYQETRAKIFYNEKSSDNSSSKSSSSDSRSHASYEKQSINSYPQHQQSSIQHYQKPQQSYDRSSSQIAPYDRPIDQYSRRPPPSQQHHQPRYQARPTSYYPQQEYYNTQPEFFPQPQYPQYSPYTGQYMGHTLPYPPPDVMSMYHRSIASTLYTASSASSQCGDVETERASETGSVTSDEYGRQYPHPHIYQEYATTNPYHPPPQIISPTTYFYPNIYPAPTSQPPSFYPPTEPIPSYYAPPMPIHVTHPSPQPVYYNGYSAAGRGGGSYRGGKKYEQQQPKKVVVKRDLLDDVVEKVVGLRVDDGLKGDDGVLEVDRFDDDDGKVGLIVENDKD